MPSNTPYDTPASVDVNTGVNADVDAAVAAQAGLRLMGFSAKETAASTATWVLMHGATVGAGTAMVNINLAASTSLTQWFGSEGISCPNGISIDRITGTGDILLFYKAVG